MVSLVGLGAPSKENTTLGDGGARRLVQLSVVAVGQLQARRDDTGFAVTIGCQPIRALQRPSAP